MFNSADEAIRWIASRFQAAPDQPADPHRERNDKIRARYHDGERIASIAREYGLTWTRVQQIVKAAAPV